MSECRLLRPSIAAKRLGVCTETVKRWLRAARLEGVRSPGGQWRVLEDAVSARLKKTTTSRDIQSPIREP